MKSINSKVTLAFILINITVTTFFSCMVFWVASSIIEKNYINVSIQTIADAARRVDMFLDKINKYSLYLSISDELVNILNKNYGDDVNYPRLFTAQVQNLTIAEGDLFAIHYFGNDGQVFHFPVMSNINSIDDLKRMNLINDRQLEENKIYWSDVYQQSYYFSYTGRSEMVFSGMRVFKSIMKPKVLGVFSIDVKESTLFEFIRNSKFGNSGKAYIIDDKGKIITSTERNSISQQLDNEIFSIVKQKDRGNAYQTISGTKILVVYDTLINTGWRIVATTSLKDVLFQADYIKGTAVIIAIAVIILSSFASLLISSKITRPIRDLTKLIKKVAKGNLDVYYKAENNDEIKDLAEGFNYMTSSLKELINKVYVEEIQLKQAQLENLQAKINPHFLYNTLDTIYWMLVISKQNDIARLVVALSDMLRYNISKSGDIVTIREEIKQIENYLFIQRTRFKDRLIVDYRIEESILDIKIIKLVIQPLVENSIKHGLECQVKKGKIIIRGYMEDEVVIIQVIDDGKGMDEDGIRIALNAEFNKALVRKPGIGLNNVDERIKMYFGKKYGLTIESKTGEGTCVSIRIPKVMEGEDTENA